MVEVQRDVGDFELEDLRIGERLNIGAAEPGELEAQSAAESRAARNRKSFDFQLPDLSGFKFPELGLPDIGFPDIGLPTITGPDISGINNAIVDATGSAYDAIVDPIVNAAGSAASEVSTIVIDTGAEAIKNLYGSTEVFRDAAGNVIEGGLNAAGEFVDLTGNIVSGIVDATGNLVSDVVEALPDIDLPGVDISLPDVGIDVGDIDFNVSKEDALEFAKDPEAFLRKEGIEKSASLIAGQFELDEVATRDIAGLLSGPEAYIEQRGTEATSQLLQDTFGIKADVALALVEGLKTGNPEDAVKALAGADLGTNITLLGSKLLLNGLFGGDVSAQFGLEGDVIGRNVEQGFDLLGAALGSEEAKENLVNAQKELLFGEESLIGTIYEGFGNFVGALEAGSIERTIVNEVTDYSKGVQDSAFRGDSYGDAVADSLDRSFRPSNLKGKQFFDDTELDSLKEKLNAGDLEGARKQALEMFDDKESSLGRQSRKDAIQGIIQTVFTEDYARTYELGRVK